MTGDKRTAMTAGELRQHMAEMEAERLRALLAKQAKAHRAMDDFVDHFLHDQLDDTEREDIRRKVRHAAERGEMEVMVMTFPSRLCTDHGRAINQEEEGWPETLPGKARDLYEGWRERGKPMGYRLRAMIINFPDGMPGDVGLFLNWAPPAA